MYDIAIMREDYCNICGKITLGIYFTNKFMVIWKEREPHKIVYVALFKLIAKVKNARNYMSEKKEFLGTLISEFIGSFLLIFFGAGCVATMVLSGVSLNIWEISVIWGLGVSIAIYVTAAVSGTHINPAVTITVAIFRGFPWRRVIPYILSQTAGTFSAAAVVYGGYQNLFVKFESDNGIIRGSAESLQTAGIFSTYPNPNISIIQAFWVEVVITAVLLLVIFAVTDDRNSCGPRGHFSAILIGITIALIGGSFGTLTGFAMNPARDFGPKLFTFIAGWGKIAMKGSGATPYFWVPICAPILGGIIGGFIYDFFIRRYIILKCDIASTHAGEDSEVSP